MATQQQPQQQQPQQQQQQQQQQRQQQPQQQQQQQQQQHAVPKGFGSFHSTSVEYLINLTEEQYKSPVLPACIQSHLNGLDELIDSLLRPENESGDDSNSVACHTSSGECIRKRIVRRRNEFFRLDPAWTFINHGAFGATFVPALEAKILWLNECERQPLAFIDRELFPLIVYIIRSLSRFVGARASDVVLTQNATTALNAVFHSIPLARGDRVLCLDIAYGSVKTMLNHYCAGRGAIVDKVVIAATLPVPNADFVVRKVRDQLVQHRYTFAVFDYISSNTALLLPVQQLVDLCHEQ